MSLLPREWRDLAVRVQSGERLGREDGLRLLLSDDLPALGHLADLARRVRVGDAVYYVNGGYINYSNVCAISCQFCAFRRNARQTDAYTLQVDEIVARASAFQRAGAQELHLVGGLHPDLPLDYYLDCLRGIKSVCPEMHIKAFTVVEVDHVARLAGLTGEETLCRLQAAGLDSLTGGGAEIFAQRVRDILCRPKLTGREWLALHRTAHRLGIATNATMLYGHVETAEECVDHLLALRELQDETGGFQCFVPLAFHPANTGLDHLPGPSGFDDLRVLATSRLLLDNFRAVKAYWVALTPPLARLALRFGANDLDGTVRPEHIYHEAGSESPVELAAAELVEMIAEVGLEPVERDGRYRPCKAAS